MITLDI